MKQIAGRAGRYGLHDPDETPCGFVTTLHSNDLPLLHSALSEPIVPITHARIGPSPETLRATWQALPRNSSTNTVYEVHHYVASLGKAYRFAEYPKLWEIATFVDSQGGELTMDDKRLMMTAPIPWRDEACMEVVQTFVRMYRNRMSVDLKVCLRNTEYMQTMLEVEEMMAEGLTPTSSTKTLHLLETFHKILGLYLWLSFRNPVAYADFERVHEWKERAEKVLEWSLQGVNASLKSKDLLEMEMRYVERRRERKARNGVDYIGRRQNMAETSLRRSEERQSAVNNFVRISG
jgi:ATP-dependent RNA helicase SUPV3L1/SUV3